MANTALPFSSSLLASPETPPKFAALSVPALPLRKGHAHKLRAHLAVAANPDAQESPAGPADTRS
jgi:hypothetical protein